MELEYSLYIADYISYSMVQLSTKRKKDLLKIKNNLLLIIVSTLFSFNGYSHPLQLTVVNENLDYLYIMGYKLLLLFSTR